MTEDPRWYDSGLAEERALLKLAEGNEEFRDAYMAEHKKHFPPKKLSDEVK